MTASVPCVPGATLMIWRCCVSLPTDTTFERPPSVEFAPTATEFEPAVTVGLSEPVPFMSAAMPVAFCDCVVLLRVVESDVNWLLMLATPVDSEPMLLDVELDSCATVLLVVLKPVDNELTPVDSELMLVAVDVDKLLSAWFVAFNWLPLTASVLVAETCPAATLVTWRSAPGAPTLTTLVGDVPAKVYETPPIVALAVGFGAAVIEPEPSATSLALFATAFEPNASEPAPTAVAVLPKEIEPVPAAVLALPNASASLPLATLAAPIDTAWVPLANAPCPTATAPLDEAFAPLPTATLLTPEALAFVPAASALVPVAPSLL